MIFYVKITRMTNPGPDFVYGYRPKEKDPWDAGNLLFFFSTHSVSKMYKR